MAVDNKDVARLFRRVADLLEIGGSNPFRVRAYRQAAATVEDMSQSVASLHARGEDLSTWPGIGKDLAGKIGEIVETGTLALLGELGRKTPVTLTELLELTSLGPKKVAVLYRELGISTLEELGAAAAAGKVRDLPGFGRKSEEKILAEIERHRRHLQRTLLADAERIVAPLIAVLGEVEGVEQVVVAGSYRRRRETVGDLDLLAICEESGPVMDRFVGCEGVLEVLSKGETRSTIRLRSNLQVDLRVVPRRSFGAALHYFTGSKDHNLAIRRMGIKRGLKVNEYGVFHEGEEEPVAGRTEEEVYAAVGLPWIAPELRENRGELEAAAAGRLPGLVELGEIRGDLHAHTRATDGRSTLEEMAAAARRSGYAYLAITEHSRSLTVARGLDPRRLERQIDEIDALNEKYDNFRIFKGIEVDILEDGSLDLPDDVLAKLDLTVCSVHSRFGLSLEKQTERIIRAMDNRYFAILGHATGRLINVRDPYPVDMERIMAAAAERGCHFEINAQPNRLDLDDSACKMAKEMGLKVAISTDAHHVGEFDNIRFGVDQARRGWLEAADVLNTRPPDELLKLLKR